MHTTRANFPDKLPTIRTIYCWRCKHTEVDKEGNDPVKFRCKKCNRLADRVLIYDPKMVMGFDDRDQLFHESVGVFIVRPSDRKVLLFKRTKFPYLLTIPAGHLEVGEEIEASAIRECEEEVGVKPENLVLLYEGMIEGDSCMGGADLHAWHAYMSTMDVSSVVLDEEGSGWGWYGIEDLTIKNTVQPVLAMLLQDGVIEKIENR